MSSDNSASAIAQKKKLQAELAAAQEELDELYYSHSVEKQQDALDKNLEDYQDEKDKEMENLDEYLKNVEQVIADSFTTVKGNTETIASTLTDIANEYGLKLSDSVISPWEQGVNAIGVYQDQLETSTSIFTQQLDSIKNKLIELQNEADNTARHLIDSTNQKAQETTSATKVTPPTPEPTPTPTPTPSQGSNEPQVGETVTVKETATNFSRNGGNGTKMQPWVPGSDFTVEQRDGNEILIGRNGQYTGWVYKNDLYKEKHKRPNEYIRAFAKGTKGVKKDQIALTDEYGLEELTLHADKNGKLQFLSKGSSVIPSDITENLMQLGSLDPREVLNRNMPKVEAPHIINNNMELNMSVGSLITIEHADSDSIPEIQKAVKSAMDSYMKNINQSLKRFTR